MRTQQGQSLSGWVQAFVLPALAPSRPGLLQRVCVGTPTLRRHPARQEGSGTPPVVREVLRSPGRPLDQATRTFMEGRFGHDFARVHTDEKAAESAQAVNALAYTVGQDVVFAAGRYSPGTVEGKKLLAHELAHAVQQSSLQSSSPNNLEMGPSEDVSEAEAEQASDRVVGPIGVPVARSIGSHRPSIQRQATTGGTESGAGQTPTMPAGAAQPSQYPDCNRRTSGVADPGGIIERAKATAITWTSIVIPMIGAAIAAPESWSGSITWDYLNRHFHCPSDEQSDYIRTTFQAIGALLPQLPLRCTNDPDLCRSSVPSHPLPYTYNEVFLCPEYFRMSPGTQAANLILRTANMLGRDGECFIENPCYGDFSVPASNMVGNGTSYGYFAREASGARSYPSRATIPCTPRQSAPGAPATTSEPARLCQDAGQLTSRTIVFPPPPGRPFVQTGSGPAGGILLEERHDASGNFVCDRERRINQTW